MDSDLMQIVNKMEFESQAISNSGWWIGLGSWPRGVKILPWPSILPADGAAPAEVARQQFSRSCKILLFVLAFFQRALSQKHPPQKPSSAGEP